MFSGHISRRGCNMYIVIESIVWNPTAFPCMDKEGETLFFETEELAQAYADENCQDGNVVLIR